MDAALAWTLFGIAVGLLGAFALAVATGQLVTSVKVETWKAAYNELKRSDDRKTTLIEKLIQRAEIADQINQAITQYRQETGETV